jgi:hypothetical protein
MENNNKIVLRFIFALLFSMFFVHAVYAADYFSILDVQYENGIKKTFLGGPYSGKAWCEKMNKNTWDHIQPVCGNCSKEISMCSDSSALNEPFRKVMNGEPAPMIYVKATAKGRIVLSGANKVVIEKECKDMALSFQLNGYPDAQCVR